MIRILYIILCFFAASALRAQDIGISLDRTRILIGEPIQVSLTAKFNGSPAAWFEIDTIPHFEILERSKIDTSGSGPAVSLSQTLKITSWDSGKWNLPALRLGTAQTNPVAITVSYSPMDPGQPYHDIRDILDVKGEKKTNWYWIFLFVIVVIALFMLFFPAGEKKEKPSFVPEPGAYREAMAKLEALRQRSWEDPGPLFTGMIFVFREYLQKRKNIHSHSKTTDDLAVRLGALDLPQDTYSSLLQTLRMSDGVKFARYRPEEGEKRDAFDTMIQSIKAIEESRVISEEWKGEGGH